MIFQPRRGAPL